MYICDNSKFLYVCAVVWNYSFIIIFFAEHEKKKIFLQFLPNNCQTHCCVNLSLTEFRIAATFAWKKGIIRMSWLECWIHISYLFSVFYIFNHLNLIIIKVDCRTMIFYIIFIFLFLFFVFCAFFSIVDIVFFVVICSRFILLFCILSHENWYETKMKVDDNWVTTCLLVV